MKKQSTIHIESPQYFNLARNLFGIEIPEEKKLKKTIAISSTVENLKSAEEKDNRIFAVYPAIVEQAFSQTMDKYRKFVALKNFMVSEENHNIKIYNSNVIAYRNPKKNKLTEVQFTMSKAFVESKSKKALLPLEYNEEVEKLNSEYGPIVRKKKLITIKPPAELVFQNFLCIYNQQLMKKNKRYMGCRVTTPTPLEPFKVNAWRVTQLKRNGAQSLPLCKKTILNHRRRLEEFGVFVNYQFINTIRPVEVHINPEILVIKDLFNDKVVIAENQSVTSESGKIVPYLSNDILTRTYKNEVKDEKKVENFPVDKEFPAVTPLIFSLTRTPTRTAQLNQGGGGAPENNAITAQYSHNIQKNTVETLLQTIVEDSVLAKQLENCEFNNYIPIDVRILTKLAYSGAITRDQNFDIAMIDFFKSLQKNIYRQKNVFFGSWYNAIKLFRLQRWNLFNGEKFQPANLLPEITQYRYRIQWARNWFRKNPNVTPLFPNQYLDVTRKTRKEVGFEFTKSKWNDQQNEIAKYDALQKKLKLDAHKRGIAINHNKNLELYLNQFFKNKITLNQLYNYVEKNLPSQFYERLSDLIESKALKINEKTISMQSQDRIRFSPSEF